MKKPKKPAAPVDNSPDKSSYLFAIFFGAFAALLAASFLSPSLNLAWLPPATNSGALLRVLGFSAICGGSVLAFFGGRKMAATPLPGIAVSLGWIVWCVSAHGKTGGMHQAVPVGTSPSETFLIFLQTVQSAGIFAAVSLLLSLLASRVIARFLDRSPGDSEETNGIRGSNFRLALGYPVFLGAIGGALMFVSGLAVYPFRNFNLPASMPLVLWSSLWISVPFGVAAYIVRRFFKTTGSGGFLVAPPLTIAGLAGLFLAARGQFPLGEPAMFLIWHSSGLEASSWGVVGSTIGYFLATREKQA